MKIFLKDNFRNREERIFSLWTFLRIYNAIMTHGFIFIWKYIFFEFHSCTKLKMSNIFREEG